MQKQLTLHQHSSCKLLLRINMNNHRYQIVHNLGNGQYGQVYLATNPQQQHYALKTTLKNKQPPHQPILLQQLKHPNIIRFIDYFQQDTVATIVMQHAANGDLSSYIKQHYPNEYIPESVIRSWVLQLTLALHYLHQEKHIIHRDVKLINVLVAHNEVLKLCDFGLAQEIVPKGQEKTSTVGTPYYLSPQSVMLGKFSAKSDIWALGCLFYEICTGHKPFTGKSMGQILKSITTGYLEQLPEQGQYSKWLITLIHSMLQKDPQRRPSTRIMLQDQQLRKQFLQLRKKHQQYKNMEYPYVQVRTKKHVMVEQKLGQNFRFAHAMLKTAKRQKSFKLPECVEQEENRKRQGLCRSQREQGKKVQRVKFASKSLRFLLQQKQWQGRPLPSQQ